VAFAPRGWRRLAYSDGRLVVLLDVARPLRRLAWVFFHETAELGYLVAHPDVQLQRVDNPSEFRAHLVQSHDRAEAFADRMMLDPEIGAFLRRAKRAVRRAAVEASYSAGTCSGVSTLPIRSTQRNAQRPQGASSPA
jgi:hypothetical protein